jgi:hypothetical protein
MAYAQDRRHIARSTQTDTDILNLVPFVGVASIQAIQAQVPGLEYDQKRIIVQRMNSMLAKQSLYIW